MIRFLCALALSGLVGATTNAQIPIELRGLDVKPTKAKFYRDGSCKFRLVLTNLSTQTLRVSGEAFVIQDNTSIGSTTVFFPPALAGRESIVDVTLYASQLAAPCREPATLIVQPQVCQLGDGTYLPDISCRISGEMTFERN